MEYKDVDSMTPEEAQAELDRIRGIQNTQPENTTEPTGTNVESDSVSSTEGQRQMPFGIRAPRPGVGGFIQDMGQGLWEKAAPAVGLLDTATDLVNLATPR